MDSATARTAGIDRLIEVEAISVAPLCAGVITADFRATGRVALPGGAPGAHVGLHLPSGLVRQYSLYDPQPGLYRVAIQREAEGRGGSAWLHDRLAAGTRLLASLPRNNFPLLLAARYRFIAGGIGITPIRSMVYAAAGQGIGFSLDFCSRTAERTPFRAALVAAPFAEQVRFVHDNGDPARGIRLDQTIAPPAGDERLYCCGPGPLMAAVEAAALAQGWPRERLHFEAFKPSAREEGAERPFTVVVKSSGEAIEIAPGQTILAALAEAGYLVDSACQEGLCGTCQVGVLEGIPDHRDEVLTASERESNRVITVCCSRALSDRLVLDL